jgi:hypothetical protein
LFQYEAWILVCVAFERLGAIFVPLRAKALFTKTFAAIQVGIVGVLILALNAHFFWTHTLVGGECDTNNIAHELFMIQVWTWMDFTVASLAPFFLMLLINVSIIARLIYLHNMRKNNQSHSSDAKVTTMTGILITVSFVFFATTAPIAIYLATDVQRKSNAITIDDFAKLDDVWASVNMAAYTNNAINFILYCLSGPRFRSEFLKMMHIYRCLRKVRPTEPSTTIATIQIVTHV